MSETEDKKPLTHAERGRLGGLAAAGSHSKYTTEQVTRALHLTAVFGSPKTASTYLRDHGEDISPGAIANWKKAYRDQFLELADKHSAELEATIVQECRETAVLAAEVERLALTRVVENTDKLQPKDAGQTAAYAAKIKGTNLQQVLALTGRPQKIVEHRPSEEVMRELQRFAVERPKAIEGTAVEV